MARKPTVTLNDVRKAIEQLEAAGHAVTVRGVIAITGGMTSLVSEMIDIVMHNRAEAARALSTLTPDLLVSVNREIDLHVTRHTTSLKEELRDNRNHLEDLREIIREFEAQREIDEEAIDTLEQQLNESRQRADEDRRRSESANDSLKNQFKSKEEALLEKQQELDSARNQIAGLQHCAGMVDELKAELSDLRKKLSDAERRAAEAEGRLDEIRNQRKNPGQAGEDGETASPKKPK